MISVIELLITLSTLLNYCTALKIPPKDHKTRQYFAVESQDDVSILQEKYTSWKFEHNVRGLANHYVFSIPLQKFSKRSTVETYLPPNIINIHDLPPIELQKRLPIGDSSMQRVDDAKTLFNISDPLFDQQWHLINPNYPGNDVNVTGLWKENITGYGVVAALVDDGLDYENDDLKDNFCSEGSWDFNDNNPLPKPRLKDDYHGTRCAGEIAAIRNDICGVGVAYNSRVSGIRILSGQITAEDEAASLVHGLDVNDIYSCSWGPADDGRTMQAPDELVKKAMIKGVTEGRSAKGALYVFASGNGGMFDDSCNFDGYTNSIYSITVGAIDWKGLHPPYSESCSAVMVVTYSSGSGNHIQTTDINQKCSSNHGGTSAAAPLAAGIYTLVLEANPTLTWRDVQYLSILSSEEINLHDGKWQESAMGKRYSHTYGFGKLDAYKIVDMARNWKNVNPQGWFYLPRVTENQSIKTSEEALNSTISVSLESMKKNNLKRIEHVTVTVDVEAPYRGHVLIDLISPSGVVSTLATSRRLDKNPTGFQNWTFMSVAHWGSSGVGDWKLQVRCTRDEEVTLKSWRLKMFGETIDPTKAQVMSYGNDKEDEGDKSTESELATSTTQTSSIAQSSGPYDPLQSTHSPALTSAVDGIPGANKLPPPEQAGYLYLAIFSIGSAIIVGYYVYFLKFRRIVRRSRAEAYEFDIIDSDSDYDTSINQTLDSLSADADLDNLEDFNFDINMEEGEIISGQENSPHNHLTEDATEDVTPNSADDRTDLLSSTSVK
ncbi:unnamed protein product [Kluyveromyces dobzhanskii CBS 2104]|uniref:WGS project CCBQ000000000 data, contig 00266 n=1 Tax=Kluyveromyces dobzhanskii CBS 2104 TaxID=1427455 RepID=A0A0A8L5E5_9SACH|nr:unnamed protein product [Kluyveromyces dobzhanskii CBS 2104]